MHPRIENGRKGPKPHWAGGVAYIEDYQAIGGLSNEAREKLTASRPATLGAAGRISGVTPAALTTLLGHVRRRGDSSQGAGNKTKIQAA